jgi:hypothetical protein
MVVSQFVEQVSVLPHGAVNVDVVLPSDVFRAGAIPLHAVDGVVFLAVGSEVVDKSVEEGTGRAIHARF